MIQEKEIEELFSSAITEFDDNSIFTSKLSRKLDKVEHLKRIQDEQKRGYRTDVILAFQERLVSAFAIGKEFSLVAFVLKILSGECSQILVILAQKDFQFFFHNFSIL